MTAGAVIVGAGQAGFQAAWSLREAGYPDPIVLVGDERRPPYGRPPLSKQALAPGAVLQPLRPDRFYADQAVDLRIDDPARRIDAEARTVALASGRELPYEHLVLATGAAPRELPVPGTELDGVVALRTAEHAEDLARRLADCTRAVVVGGGFIGLEVAAAARARGIDVTVVEAQDRLLARALSPEVAAHLAEMHRAAGVALRFGAGVERILGADGTVAGVRLSDGVELAAELVVVGIGVTPNVALAEAAGLPTRDGIVVDRSLRTSDPAIWAIGDCARFPLDDGGDVRIESVQNATDHARLVAAAIVTGEGAYDAVPWFWSDQYGTRLQIAGLGDGSDLTVVRGDGGADGLSAFRFRDGRLLAVESVGRPKDHMAARKLLAARVAVTPEQAADATLPLKSLLGDGR